MKNEFSVDKNKETIEAANDKDTAQYIFSVVNERLGKLVEGYRSVTA